MSKPATRKARLTSLRKCSIFCQTRRSITSHTASLQVNNGFAPSHALRPELNVHLRVKLKLNRETAKNVVEENAAPVAAGEDEEERERRKNPVKSPVRK